jgi:ATP-binding cassette subfamily F protein uup
LATPTGSANNSLIDNAPKKAAEKMSYKEKLELEQLNKTMPALEIKKASLTSELNNTTVDYNAITALSAQLASVTAELEASELRWLELSEKL